MSLIVKPQNSLIRSFQNLMWNILYLTYFQYQKTPRRSRQRTLRPQRLYPLPESIPQTDEEKEEANNSFIVLQAAIESYNAKANVVNEEMEKATEVAFIPISAATSTFIINASSA